MQSAPMQNPMRVSPIPLALRTKALTILAVLAIVIPIDQITKEIAKTTLRGQGVYSYLGDTFRLVYSENSGAFLSLGAGLPDSARFWVFTVMVAVFLFGIFYYLLRHPADLQTTLSYSLLLAGGLSNLGDRMFRDHGRVIDFMNMGIGELRTGIFNIADMAIMLGVGIVLFTSFKKKDPETKAV